MTTTKNTFCLDHVVGVLRYLACSDGPRKIRLDGYGIISYSHTQYARQSISDYIDMLVVKPVRKYVVGYCKNP